MGYGMCLSYIRVLDVNVLPLWVFSTSVLRRQLIAVTLSFLFVTLISHSLRLHWQLVQNAPDLDISRSVINFGYDVESSFVDESILSLYC